MKSLRELFRIGKGLALEYKEYEETFTNGSSRHDGYHDIDIVQQGR